MKTAIKKQFLASTMIWAFVSMSIFAIKAANAHEGGASSVGGGGDASEARVNEIRSDILNWINDGGSANLVLPRDIKLDFYNEEMRKVLKPKYVKLAFVENNDSPEEELRVEVNGKPKTCRGFVSRIDGEPHILCHIGRFEKTSESDQYRLIHHEYAGLAGVERNDGSASDYEISNQLTDYLKEETVLRLSVKKQVDDLNVNYKNFGNPTVGDLLITASSSKNGVCKALGFYKGYVKGSARITENKWQKIYFRGRYRYFNDGEFDTIKINQKGKPVEYYPYKRKSFIRSISCWK